MSQRHYELGPLLGEGSFGAVYRAELRGDGDFRKIVALKILHEDIARRGDALARLRDEARMLGLVRHPALLGADGLVQLQTGWAVVMEYVEGESLTALSDRLGPLPDAVVAHVGVTVGRALQAALDQPHEGRPLGLVHRDVKPSNLQLSTTGQVRVLDFGIARADFQAREARTQSMVMGSPPYMSPERCVGDDSAEGDVFALGASLAQLLTGRRPGPVEIAPDAHAARIHALLEGVSGDWRERLEPLLRYRPDERPSAGAVADSLSAWCNPMVERWAVDNVRGTAEQSGPLTGVVLTEGTPPEVVQIQGPTPSIWPQVSLLGCLGVILLGMLMLGGTLVVVVWAGLGVLGSTLGEIDRSGCASMADEQLERFEGLEGDAEDIAAARVVGVKVQRACGTRDLGTVGIALFATTVDQVVEDGRVSAEERAELERFVSIHIGSPQQDR